MPSAHIAAQRPGGRQPAALRNTTPADGKAARDGVRDGANMRMPRTSGGGATLTAYSEAKSRALFHAADRNQDDRLDLFEAGAALSTLRDMAERGTFRRLDTNRDGFLEWPEFDAHVVHVLKLRGRLHVAVPLEADTDALAATPAVARATGSPGAGLATGGGSAREAAAAKGGATTITAGPVFSLLDIDKDGLLGAKELMNLLKQRSLPPAALKQLPRLDRDGDGKLSPQELVLAERMVPGLIRREAAGAATAASALSVAGDAVALDADGSGAIDSGELRAALRRIDPALGRHAERLVRAADRNGSGTVEPGELRR